MDSSFTPKYRIITLSGKIATGTSTLSKNLVRLLGWKYVNFGALQREYDRKHGINENKQGALARPDDHERKMEEMGEKLLKEEKMIKRYLVIGRFPTGGIYEEIEYLPYQDFLKKLWNGELLATSI